MKHFVITRFNLQSADWELTRQGEKVLSTKWLEERFDLFSNYCLPSVENQSNSNFYWCVFFDRETPVKFRNKIDAISERMDNFVPFFIENLEALNSTCIEFIESKIDNATNYIITTRLDNDDIIHKDFIDVIQNHYPLSENLVIDLQRGYQINMERGGNEIRKIHFPFNQFISFVERRDTQIKTVMNKQHQEWKRHENVFRYVDRELWIELIHSSNKWNDVRSKFKRNYRFNNLDFGILPPLEFREKAWEVAVNNLCLDLATIRIKIVKKFFRK